MKSVHNSSHPAVAREAMNGERKSQTPSQPRGLTAAGFAAALALLAGCAVGPDYQKPQANVPAAFAATADVLPVSTNAAAGTLAEWWTVFGDARLNELVREAASANHDLRLAQSRVREARALRGVARSALFPEIGAGGSYHRHRQSENTLSGQPAQAADAAGETDAFDAALDLSWELDVFGGNRRRAEAAAAEFGASIETARGTLVAVLAEVGLNYLELRGAQKQLGVARENLATQEQTLLLTRDRFKAGLASELDTARALSLVEGTRAQLPPLEEAAQRAIHRLSVLLGRAPAELNARLATTAPLPSAPPGVPLGLPSDLLRQRPDLRRAEREVAAANARIGVAAADHFPKFFLTGAAGLQSVEGSDLLDAGSRFWSLGPSLRWPIFAGGRIRQNIRVQEARHEQALLRYEQAVLRALEEVENALVAFGKEQDRFRALTASEQASRRSVALADERYRGGLVDFLDVLEAERSLLAVQGQVVQSEQRLSQNLVRLYLALGGGWPAEPTQLASQ